MRFGNEGGAGGGAGGGILNAVAAADAIRRSRDGTVIPGDISSFAKSEGNLAGRPTLESQADFPTNANVDTPAGFDTDLSRRLSHWDEWTIPHLIIPDLMQPLMFDVANRDTVTIQVASLTKFEMIRPTRKFFESQLPDVIADADLREDRSSEILAQIQDIASFFSALLPQTLDRKPATQLLLQTAHRLAISVEVRLKHEFACARPAEYSPQVQPMIRTPGHGTYPMGHSCEAFVYAYLLEKLTKDAEDEDSDAWHALSHQLRAVAWRIGENRIVAGVHFPIDLYAGQGLAQWLVQYLEYCAIASANNTCFPHPKSKSKDDVKYASFVFDPTKLSDASHQGVNLLAMSATAKGKGSVKDLPANLVWRKLWQTARQEWRLLNRHVNG